MARPELHVLTDPGLSGGRPHAELARAALAGGADVIQLRDKTIVGAALEAAARAVRAAVRAGGGVLVVNDDVELARVVGADGVHVGPDDLPVAEVRARWAGRLGASARTVETARRAEADGADYLGVGPVWGTVTKPGLPPPIGLERLAEVAQAVSVPVIAIGGVTAGNAADAVRAGAAGVAVIGAVAGAADPEAAARALRRALDGAGG